MNAHFFHTIILFRVCAVKSEVLHNLVGRKGLPVHCHSADSLRMISSYKSLASENDKAPQKVVAAVKQLEITSGAFMTPHPFKRPEGIAMNQRHYGCYDLCTDLRLCEDSYFCLTATNSIDNSNLVYLCVADGVGIWRQYGLDPRLYSHRLVQYTKEYLMRNSTLTSVRSDDSVTEVPPLVPSQDVPMTVKAVDRSSGEMMDNVLTYESLWTQPCDAWDGVTSSSLEPQDVITASWAALNAEKRAPGSATLCLVSIDCAEGVCRYANIGDCGLLILRRHNSTSFTIAHSSQQQLKDFNLPYQLGYR